MYIENILNYLKKQDSSKRPDYGVPREWLPQDYEGMVKLSGKYIFVNPYEFGKNTFETIMSRRENDRDYLLPLSRIEGESKSNWIEDSVIYSAFLRMTTAFGHKNPGSFNPYFKGGYTEAGTILKQIFLLPYLKKIGINTIYFLPVTKYSGMFKKGEVGSPYSVKDFYKISDEYHDNLLVGFSVEDEFKAFVEAAHILGMRVILDFIPRTCARDSDLILEHPDWFYWIDYKELENYKAPLIDELAFEQPSSDNLSIMYSNESVKEHLKKFKFAPNITDPEKWGNFVNEYRGKKSFLDGLIKEFGVITPPGFSDWINDNQPPWNDVTFLRMYMDHPKEAKKYLKEDQPPYVLYDVIKSSIMPGEEPNKDLWDLIANIMPYYNREFGVDGARLDMGHALPSELEKEMIKSAKRTDPSFSIIAEELNMNNDGKAKDNGYDCFLGNVWWSEPRVDEGWTKKLIYEVLPNLKLTCFGAVETPDTPRAMAREYGKDFAIQATILNFFLPKTVPFINSGQEIFELQPMNLGLDNTEDGRYLLEPSDPMYGKLAFFDYYSLHWNSDDDMLDIIEIVSKIRMENLDLLRHGEIKYLFKDDKDIVALFYWNGEKGLLVLSNFNYKEHKNLFVDLGYYTWKEKHEVLWKIKNRHYFNSMWNVGTTMEVILAPGEIYIAQIE